MKKAVSFPGGVSLLLILLMLTLTAFGLLTLVSAHSDYKLSGKNAESADRFYTLDTQGQRALRDLETAFARLGDQTQALSAEGWTITQQSPLTAVRTWERDGVTLMAEVVWAQTGPLQIRQWVIAHPVFDYDDGLDIWEGE